MNLCHLFFVRTFMLCVASVIFNRLETILLLYFFAKCIQLSRVVQHTLTESFMASLDSNFVSTRVDGLLEVYDRLSSNLLVGTISQLILVLFEWRAYFHHRIAPLLWLILICVCYIDFHIRLLVKHVFELPHGTHIGCSRCYLEAVVDFSAYGDLAIVILFSIALLLVLHFYI